jgi:arabinose-5-phosphate isomerase
MIEPVTNSARKPAAAQGSPDTVLNVMKTEAAAIQRAADDVDRESIEQALAIILACVGKVVVSGVGKSGYVARKMAASLNSTGTPAVFVHAADAGHGDLGVIEPDDVVLLVSHSGQSDEILALLPHLQNRQLPIVAIVGNRRSALGLAASVAIDVPVDGEACPLNLAPHASSAVAQSICDGIVSAIMQARGFTATDFARNHPAGRLGKRLTLRVRDIMHCGDNNPVVSPDTPWPAVLSAMCKYALGAVNVVDATGGLVGIITDGDIRRAVEQNHPGSLAHLTAADTMTHNPITVSHACLAVDALTLMEARTSQISVLPVIEAGCNRCIGLVRLHDVLRSGLL